MSQAASRWEISGEYFENCSCEVVCPCEVSSQGPLQAKPDQGYCNVYLVFHVNQGRYGGVDLAGLNAVLAVHSPGPMAQGNWTVAAYVDARASAEQQSALGTIFSGGAGGPLAALGPLVGNNLGAKAVPLPHALWTWFEVGGNAPEPYRTVGRQGQALDTVTTITVSP